MSESIQCSDLRSLIASLFAHRRAHLTQQGVADAAGIPSGRISAIERKPSHLLRVSELESYISGLNVQLSITWTNNNSNNSTNNNSTAKAPIKAPEPVYTVVDSEEPDGFVPPEDAIWDDIKGMWFSADAGCYYNEDGEEIPIES